VKEICFEIIVVDNASTDQSTAMLKQNFPDVRLIQNEENVGFARANNQAIQRSLGSYLLLLNSDAVLLPKTVNILYKHARTRSEIGALGTQWLNPDGTFQASYNNFPTLMSEFFQALGIYKIINPFFPSYPPQTSIEITDCDWVGGACMLLRRSAIDQVGLLDESYFMYVEEMDFCYRLRRAEWKVVYLPDAKVIHYGGGSASRNSYKQQFLLYKSKITYFQKHHSSLSAFSLRVLIHFSAALKSLYWFSNGTLSRDGRKPAWERAHNHWKIASSSDL
jgi:N-acetylglucosaminyl-diphospho-decaprenol L-rhamnosyltransferase